MWRGQHSGGEPGLSTAGERAGQQALAARASPWAGRQAEPVGGRHKSPLLTRSDQVQVGASPPPGSWLDCEVIFVHLEDLRATMGEQSSSFKALLINLKAP